MINEAAFDESAYLEANPDVRRAVNSGSLESGHQHYELFGRREGRLLRASDSQRTKLLLQNLDLARVMGLEIGALDKPLVRKADGDITYVDYADTDFLRRRYAKDINVDCANIVNVDAIWGKHSLREAVGEGVAYDYVLASHVIEHVPDLITWLQEIRSVLKSTGTVRLAIPDKRYTFDYAREVSSISDMLDAHLRRARAPLPRMILDFYLQARHVDVGSAWRGPLNVATLERVRTDQAAIATARDAYENGTYHDVHCWVFTPRTFCEGMARLNELQLTDFGCLSMIPTQPDLVEFFVQMAPAASSDDARISWEEAAGAE